MKTLSVNPSTKLNFGDIPRHRLYRGLEKKTAREFQVPDLPKFYGWQSLGKNRGTLITATANLVASLGQQGVPTEFLNPAIGYTNYLRSGGLNTAVGHLKIINTTEDSPRTSALLRTEVNYDRSGYSSTQIKYGLGKNLNVHPNHPCSEAEFGDGLRKKLLFLNSINMREYQNACNEFWTSVKDDVANWEVRYTLGELEKIEVGNQVPQMLAYAISMRLPNDFSLPRPKALTSMLNRSDIKKEEFARLIVDQILVLTKESNDSYSVDLYKA